MSSDRATGTPATGQLLKLKERVEAPDHVTLPDDSNGLTWRSIHADDADRLLELARFCDPIDNPQRVTASDEITELFELPTLELATDTAIALDEQGHAVAYGIVLLGEQHDTIVWVTLEGAVHPERRNQGIGEALLAWQESRGIQILSTRDEVIPARLATGAEEHATSALRLLHRSGYRAARWWLELERSLTEPIPDIPLDAAVRIEPYDEWREPTRLAFNEAFRDHWGSQPATEREWAAGDQMSSARPDLSFVAVDVNEQGDKVVAFAIASVPVEDWGPRGHSFGSIEMLGVRPAWRGRGIAAALLTHTMKALRDEELETAVLQVDSESLTGAVGLYERVGFRTIGRSCSLVKEF